MGAFRDLTGQTFNRLTVLYPLKERKNGSVVWHCKCECGNECDVVSPSLIKERTKSCGCLKKETDRAPKGNAIDMVGKKYGHLTVISRDNSDKYGHAKWLCQCDCGNQCLVQHQYLTCGDTNSCGCVNSIGNMTINRLLTKWHYKYKAEYEFKDFICNSYPYKFDFALLDDSNNLLGLIEYQGDIHFTYNNSGWNTKIEFDKRIKRDKNKKEYCQKNNIKLYYITYKDDIEEKLKEILNELYG